MLEVEKNLAEQEAIDKLEQEQKEAEEEAERDAVAQQGQQTQGQTTVVVDEYAYPDIRRPQRYR